LPNSEWIQGICQEFPVGRRKHFETAGGVGGDQLVVAGLHRRIDGVARAEPSPQPWQARWPQLSELVRCMLACTLRFFRGQQTVAGP